MTAPAPQPKFGWLPGDSRRCEFCRDLLRESRSIFGYILLDEQGIAVCRARTGRDPDAPSKVHLAMRPPFGGTS